METGGMFVGVALFLLFVFVVIGGPAMLVDWMRARRHEVTRRQIALTDALDGHFGTIVSPVVRRPMWGPWEIEIARAIQPVGSCRQDPRRGARGPLRR
jgi:hypothetical protein